MLNLVGGVFVARFSKVEVSPPLPWLLGKSPCRRASDAWRASTPLALQQVGLCQPWAMSTKSTSVNLPQVLVALKWPMLPVSASGVDLRRCSPVGVLILKLKFQWLCRYQSKPNHPLLHLQHATCQLLHTMFRVPQHVPAIPAGIPSLGWACQPFASGFLPHVSDGHTAQ